MERNIKALLARRQQEERAKELRELSRDVMPEKVLDEMERHARHFQAIPRRDEER